MNVLKLVISILFLILVNVGSAQDSKLLDSAKFSADSTYFVTPQKDTIYVLPQINAGFNGGQKGWDKYLMMNINSGVPESNGALPGNYTAQALYVINKEGEIDKVEIITDPGYGMASEFIRVLKNAPNWYPAKRNGVAVQSLRSQNITFILDSTNKDTINGKLSSDSIVLNPEQLASFPGGDEAWIKFLSNNIESNVPTIHDAPAGIYTVIVSFEVDTNGAIINIKTLSNPGYFTAEEVIRVVKKSPRWIPGMHHGKLVKAYRTQRFSFQVMNK